MLSYQQIQASGLVRAATVGSFTRPNVQQLVVFKEFMVEIWEIEKEKPVMVVTTGLFLTVCHCVLLQSPLGFANLASKSLDRILATDNKGDIRALEWSISKVDDVAISVMFANSEKCEPVLPHPVFSKPLTFGPNTPLSSLVQRSREMDVEAKHWFGKIRSITLVATALYQNLIQLVVAAWVPVTQEKDLQETSSHRPLMNKYILNMEEPMSVSIASQLQRVPTILDLAFIQGLDWKAHPLLVVLFGQHGLIYNLVTIECFSIDLAAGKIQQGPWKISNLHPTSTLVLPWRQDCQLTCQTCDGSMMDTGLKQGTGVLVISSQGLLFIDFAGNRASIHFAFDLDGLPVCSEIIQNFGLVLGVSSGALYVMDLKQWDRHIIQKLEDSVSYSPAEILLLLQASADENSNAMNLLFFLSGKTCNSKFIVLDRVLIAPADITQTPVGLSASVPKRNMGLFTIIEGAMSWHLKEIKPGHTSLSDATYIHDMIMVDDPKYSPVQHILLVAGSAPNATIRRGTLGLTFNDVKISNNKIDGRPQIIPIKWDAYSEYNTHILLSYAAQGRTEIVTLDGEIESVSEIQGLEREHFTLAASVVSGDWLVQVTSFSMRVLCASTPRTVVAEWIPLLSETNGTCKDQIETERQSCQNILHASLSIEGAVLVNKTTVYSVKVKKSGKVQKIATNMRDHEISALGVFEFWITGDSMDNKRRSKSYAKRHMTSPPIAFADADLYFIVVIAHWSSNTVHLLTWPDLEEISSIQTGSAPVRCVHVGIMGKEQYLVIGKSDGSVLFFQIKYEIPSAESTLDSCLTANNSRVVEKESVRCLIMMSHLQIPMQPSDECNQSLKHYSLKLMNGKCLRLGGSIEHMVSGPMCGPEYDCMRNMRRNNPDYLLIQANRCVVLCPQEDGELQALVVCGSFHPFVASSRVNIKRLPNGLLVLSRGHLVFGHLDIWQIATVLGTPRQLAYHCGSGCVAINSNDGSSLRLSLVHVESMCQVLTLHLGIGQHPTALKVLLLPCVNSKEEEASKECIVVASQKSKMEHDQGMIHFFEFNKIYPSERQVQYELSLLGIHCTSLPCHAISLLKSQEEVQHNFGCDICDISCYIDGFEPLDSVLKHMSYGSSHWNAYCREQAQAEDLDRNRGSLLLLGYHGKVEILSLLIGDSLNSILLVPFVTRVIKAVIPSLQGKHSDDYETGSPYLSDIVVENEENDITCQVNGANTHTQHWDLPRSLICITKLTEFPSPGKGCVTDLMDISNNTFLVVEMLQGVSVFRFQDNVEVMQLAWHPFSQPCLALAPLNPDLYLVSIHDGGLQLMERNYAAELTFQDEEKRLRETDLESFGVPLQSEQDPNRNLDLASTANLGVSRHELPGFNIVIVHPSPTTVLQVQVGSLGTRPTPFEVFSPKGKYVQSLQWHATSVTPTGEVGVLRILLEEA